MGRHAVLKVGRNKNIEGFSEKEALERLKVVDSEINDFMRKAAEYREANRIEFFDKEPNPGPNPLQAELLEAWMDPLLKVFTYTGANRIGKCVTISTRVDTPNGGITVGELYERGKPFDVYAWDGERKIVVKASAPFKKLGLHKCYSIKMPNGSVVEAADHHRVLTSLGWTSVERLASCFHNLQGSSLEPFPLTHTEGAGRLIRTESSFQDHCFAGRGPCGELLPMEAGIYRSSIPSQDDALRLGFSLFYLDGSGCKHTNTSLSVCDPLSIPDGLDQISVRFYEFLFHTFGKTSSSFCEGYPLSQTPSNAANPEPLSDLSVDRHQFHACDSFGPPFYMVGEYDIKSITSIPTWQEVYDFEVPEYHNYFAGGLVHHNTTIGVLIAISTLVGRFPWSEVKMHFGHTLPRKVRYVGQDWEKHIKAVLMPELDKWWPKNRAVKTKKNNQGIDAFWIDEKTGSSLEIMSNLQDSELHEGWSGDLVVYDEPPKRDIRVANARGLIDRHGRELFCMTLLKEAWVDREVIKAVDKDGKPDRTVFNVHGDIYSNVGYGITREGIEQFEKTLTDEEKSARLRGIPSYMSGLVFPSFNRKMHLRRRFQVPLNWIVDVGIDVHPREKQAVLFIATDERNQRWVVNEIWDHGDGKWIGENIVRCVRHNAYRIGRIVCDPLAKGDKNNPNTTYDKIMYVLAAHGLPLETATKDKDSGIREIKNHLVGPNLEPSLFIFDDLIRTIFEIEGWMWDKDTQKPMDKDDHCLENMYRLLMLNTRYYDVGDKEEEGESNPNSGRSPIGGY